MGKIKAWYRSIPLWLTIFLYTAAALAAASFLSDRVIRVTYLGMGKIALVHYDLVLEGELDHPIDYHPLTGEDEGGTVFIRFEEMTEEETRRYDMLQDAARYGPFFIYSAALLAAALLIYVTRLKKPIALLETASAKIAASELDFSLDYSGRDEMARLCAAFEKMRSALDENNRRMMGMVEERKQLNDAYTHDLRTPIAVLKGYTGILAKFLPTGQLPPERVIATVNTMAAHVDRLEQFVNSMNTAQKLADLTVSRERVEAGPFIAGLRETAELLCEREGLLGQVESHVEDSALDIDPAAVTQVFENLLGNALRFAKERVGVEIGSDGAALTLRVTDDGPGFTEKELLTAAKPYYCGRQDGETYHFGLGLHICRTLCQKHGGSLRLENGENGGARVTAVFAME